MQGTWALAAVAVPTHATATDGAAAAFRTVKECKSASQCSSRLPLNSARSRGRRKQHHHHHLSTTSSSQATRATIGELSTTPVNTSSMVELPPTPSTTATKTATATSQTATTTSNDWIEGDVRSARGRAWDSPALGVRDYELDQFGVVNNAVYLNYLQHARHEWMDGIGCNIDEATRASGFAFAIPEYKEIKFYAPLRSGDRFFVRLSSLSVTAARLNVYHEVYKYPRLNGEHHSSSSSSSTTANGRHHHYQHHPFELVCTAIGVVVLLNAAYRPVRLPAFVREAALRYLRT
eukprot:jgi/Chlat1/8760/Chrsp9S08576